MIYGDGIISKFKYVKKSKKSKDFPLNWTTISSLINGNHQEILHTRISYDIHNIFQGRPAKMIADPDYF